MSSVVTSHQLTELEQNTTTQTEPQPQTTPQVGAPQPSTPTGYHYTQSQQPAKTLTSVQHSALEPTSKAQT